MPAMRVCSATVVLQLLCSFESAGRGHGPLIQGSAVLVAGVARSYRFGGTGRGRFHKG